MRVLSKPVAYDALRGGASHRCYEYIRHVCQIGFHYSIPTIVDAVTENGDEIKRNTFDVFQVVEQCFGSHRPKTVPTEVPDEQDLIAKSHLVLLVQHLEVWRKRPDDTELTCYPP